MKPLPATLIILFLQVPGLVLWLVGFFQFVMIMPVAITFGLFSGDWRFSDYQRILDYLGAILIGYLIVCFSRALRGHRLYQVPPSEIAVMIAEDLLIQALAAVFAIYSIPFGFYLWFGRASLPLSVPVTAALLGFAILAVRTRRRRRRKSDPSTEDHAPTRPPFPPG